MLYLRVFLCTLLLVTILCYVTLVKTLYSPITLPLRNALSTKNSSKHYFLQLVQTTCNYPPTTP